MNSPELFAADVASISLDATDESFLRAVTRSIAGELQVSMTEKRLIQFVSHVRGWDATPGGIKHYLRDWAGHKWTAVGFWLRDDRHGPWNNRFYLLGDREQTVLRLFAALVTLHLTVVSYRTLRSLFVDYCGRNVADLDAAILSLRDAGWVRD